MKETQRNRYIPIYITNDRKICDYRRHPLTNNVAADFIFDKSKGDQHSALFRATTSKHHTFSLARVLALARFLPPGLSPSLAHSLRGSHSRSFSHSITRTLCVEVNDVFFSLSFFVVV